MGCSDAGNMPEAEYREVSRMNTDERGMINIAAVAEHFNVEMDDAVRRGMDLGVLGYVHKGGLS